MTLRRDDEYWIRNIAATVLLTGAFLCFKIGLDMSWGFCIGFFTPIFLLFLLDAIGSGRTFIMDAEGITVTFGRFQKNYLWEELQTKCIEEYAPLT